MTGDYLNSDAFDAEDRRDLAKTNPKENHLKSIRVTIKVKKGGGTNTEDALWNERSRKIPFTDGPIPSFEVEICPGDHFYIRGRHYKFAGVNCYNRQNLLFRPIDENGETEDYTPSITYLQLHKSSFANAFGSKEDTYFECKRIEEPINTESSLLNSALNKLIGRTA